MTDAPDVSMWMKLLSEPTVQNACVILKLHIEGPIVEANGRTGEMVKTLVSCARFAAGSLDLKAIWEHGSIIRWNWSFAAPCPTEKSLVRAFDVFLGERALGNDETAGVSSFNEFGKAGKNFFCRGTDERNTMWLVRQMAELPDDRGPGSSFDVWPCRSSARQVSSASRY